MTQDLRPGGKTLHDALQDAMIRGDYAGQSDVGKQLRIQSVYLGYKQAALGALLREDEALRSRVEAAQAERQIAAMPVEAQPAARERVRIGVGR
jgi:hypothetical protein